MMNYILLSNLSIVVFYLVYKALFQQDSFLKWRRAYLLFAIVFSLGFPLIDIPYIQLSLTNPNTFNSASSEEYIRTAVKMMEEVIVMNTSNQINWWIVIYGGIILFLLGLLIVRFLAIYRLKKNAKAQFLGDDKVWVSTENISPFSFFRLIMLSKSDLESPHLQMILQHEKTHVQQWHSIDVIMSEILCIIYFFNPLVYLLKQEIRINLEYLADQNCSKTFKEPKAYQYAILQVAVNQPYIKISNHFNYSPIKQRIMMLNKQKSNRTAMLKYIGILPMVLALFLLSQCSKPQKEIAEAEFKMSMKDGKFKKQETIKETVEFMDLDTPPSFSGGHKAFINYLASNIKYPKEAKDNGVEGRVYIQFVIDTLGDVKDVNILGASGTVAKAEQDTIVWNFVDGAVESNFKNVDGFFENFVTVNLSASLILEEALRVVKTMPKWQPGKMGDKAVNVKFQVPIVFKKN